MTVRMTGGKASEFRGRGLASGVWMGGRVRGRLKGHGVVRSGVNLDGVGVNPGESESSIFYYWGGGAQDPQMYRQKKVTLYVRASEASERLRNIYFRSPNRSARTINAVPCSLLLLMAWRCIDSIMTKY